MTETRDESADALADRTLTALRAALTAEGTDTVSILIDPTLSDRLLVEACVQDALTRGKAVRIQLPHIHDDVDPDATPYLLHIEQEASAERVVNASIALAAFEASQSRAEGGLGRSVCAWIVGEANPQALAVRLANAAKILRPDGNLWYLRYWDPRVMWHLPRVLPQGQWSALQRDLGEWWALDQLNQFVSRASPATANANASIAAERNDHLTPRTHRVKIATPVWERLSLIGATNTVLGMAWEWGVIPTTANAQRIESMLRRCRALGFESSQDELVFCSCGLTSRDDFDSHPAVSEALTAAAKRRTSVAHALESFDEPFWAAMSQHRPEPQT
jgi:Domain of unknown function (DUF4123)